MKHVRKMRSPIFFYIENTFIGSECYIDGKGELSAIFQHNHCCDRCTFVCNVTFFIYPFHRTLPPLTHTLTDFRDLFAQLCKL